MPINKPGVQSEEVTDYRIQLSFDGGYVPSSKIMAGRMVEAAGNVTNHSRYTTSRPVHVANTTF
jgi:hypothetical protein